MKFDNLKQWLEYAQGYLAMMGLILILASIIYWLLLYHYKE